MKIILFEIFKLYNYQFRLHLKSGCRAKIYDASQTKKLKYNSRSLSTFNDSDRFASFKSHLPTSKEAEFITACD